MVARSDGTYSVVDVKVAVLEEESRVGEVLNWTGQLCAAKGWGYEVWTGADPVVIRNVRFLAAGRRALLLDQGIVETVRSVARTGLTLAQIERRTTGPRHAIHAAALSLLWSGAWRTDLSAPLSMNSVVTVAERAA